MVESVSFAFPATERCEALRPAAQLGVHQEAVSAGVHATFAKDHVHDHHMITNSAVAETLADCIAVSENEPRSLCELVDGTMVEIAMGFEAPVVATTVARILGYFVSSRRLGLVSGADGFFRLPSSTRAPDVAFLGRDRLPNG